jgi:hypothetical protein
VRCDEKYIRFANTVKRNFEWRRIVVTEFESGLDFRAANFNYFGGFSLKAPPKQKKSALRSNDPAREPDSHGWLAASAKMWTMSRTAALQETFSRTSNTQVTGMLHLRILLNYLLV